MLYHTYHLGVEIGSVPFSLGYLYVEFFFIVTGYFTFNHYYNVEKRSLDDVAKDSIIYTFKKFFVFFPYILIIVTLVNTYNYSRDQSRGLHSYLDMLREIILISRSDGNVGVLWFLSALFLLFPLFCCFCQIQSKFFLYILAGFFCAIYYEQFNASVIFPYHLVRALAGLLLGVVVFYLALVIKKIEISAIGKVIITIMEEVSLMAVIYFMYNNRQYSERIIIELFVVSLTIMLSGKSYTSKIKSKFLRFLGRLSFVIYICHLSIYDIIQNQFPLMSYNEKLSVGIIISIVFSLMLYFVIEKTKKFLKNDLKSIS